MRAATQIKFALLIPILQVSGGLTFRVFEWQAVAVARYLAGRAILPSRKEMKSWEVCKIAKSGNGMQFFNLSPEFEAYFEGLRLLAGEPAVGTTGRILHKFEPKWVDAFLDVVKARNLWWENERRKAEEAMDQPVGLKL